MLTRKMGRWLLPALAVLGVFAWCSPAKAAWNYEPVRWRHFGRGDIGFSENPLQPTATSNGISPRGSDTTYVSGAAARVDTTAEWSMLECEPSPTGAISIGGATADSSQVGAVIVAGDSTVASTFTWGATICQIQVNYGAQSTGWTSVGSTISPLATTTQKSIIFPIWQLPVITAHLGSTTFNATYNIFAPRVRALITWGTSAAVPSARVYVRKWIGNVAIQQPYQTLKQVAN